MATKNNPGRFDCYAHAGDNEPMFVLLARDAAAPQIVRDWTSERIRLGKNNITDDQIQEALACASNMETWHKANRP